MNIYTNMAAAYYFYFYFRMGCPLSVKHNG